MLNTKSPPIQVGILCDAHASGLRQGVVDGAECVADLGSEQAHNSDDDDSDEGEDDRIFDEALAFFFRCK